MSDAEIYTPESPFLTGAIDNEGRAWRFAYWGSDYIYIREAIEEDAAVPTGARVNRNDWSHQINLADYDVKPDQVTREWLVERSAQWVIDRNDDLRKGNL